MTKVIFVIILLIVGITVQAQTMNKPTEEQIRAYAMFGSTSTDSAMKAKIESAKLRASMVLATQACANKIGADKLLTRWVVPGEMANTVINTPIYLLDYHDKNSCLSVSRVDDFKEPAKNALSFRAIFVSDSSGESVTNRYVLVRQSDGEWMISMASNRGGA